MYKGASLIATFHPPATQAGVLWSVFQLEGSSLTAINEMIRIQDFPAVPGTFLRAPDSSDEVRAIVQDWRRVK